MTIKELYTWAKENGYEEFDLRCDMTETDTDTLEVQYLDTFCASPDIDLITVDKERKDLAFNVFVRF